MSKLPTPPPPQTLYFVVRDPDGKYRVMQGTEEQKDLFTPCVSFVTLEAARVFVDCLSGHTKTPRESCFVCNRPAVFDEMADPYKKEGA